MTSFVVLERRKNLKTKPLLALWVASGSLSVGVIGTCCDNPNELLKESQDKANVIENKWVSW
jgi:hypothetical protein